MKQVNKMLSMKLVKKKIPTKQVKKKIYLKLNFVTKREEERPKKKLRNQDIVQQALIIL